MTKTEELKQKLLEVLQYPPNSMTTYMIEKAVKKKYTNDEYSEAATQLLEEDKIEIINNWFTKKRKNPISDWSKDDIEWLTGTGRFRQ